MTDERGEMIETAVRRLDFVSGMLLAWDVDRIEVDEEIIDGWWYMIECIKRDLEKIATGVQHG